MFYTGASVSGVIFCGALTAKDKDEKTRRDRAGVERKQRRELKNGKHRLTSETRDHLPFQLLTHEAKHWQAVEEGKETKIPGLDDGANPPMWP